MECFTATVAIPSLMHTKVPFSGNEVKVLRLSNPNGSDPREREQTSTAGAPFLALRERLRLSIFSASFPEIFKGIERVGNR